MIDSITKLLYFGLGRNEERQNYVHRLVFGIVLWHVFGFYLVYNKT